MVGRNSRTGALNRYLEALPQTEGNNHNHFSQPHTDKVPQPYTSKNNHNDAHPPPAIDSVLTNTDELHVLSDVTSDSDVSEDEDQTLSLLSRDERLGHSQQFIGSNPHDVNRSKQSKFKRNSPGSYQQHSETEQKSLTPSPNKWKDALRRHSKQKQSDGANSRSARDTNSSTPISIEKKDVSGPSSWKNALRRKTSSFKYQQHEQPEEEEEEEEKHEHGHQIRSNYEFNSGKQTDNYNRNESEKGPGIQSIPKWKRPQAHTSNEKNLKITTNYESDQMDVPGGDNSYTDSALSIKDRIRKFGGANETPTSLNSSVSNKHKSFRVKTNEDRNFQKSPTHSNHTIPSIGQDVGEMEMRTKEGRGREHTDVYEDFNHYFNDNEEDDIPMAPSPSRIPPSPLAAAAADAAAELVRQSMTTAPPRNNLNTYTNFNDVSVKNRNNHNSSTIASNFLAAVNDKSSNSKNGRDRKSRPTRSTQVDDHLDGNKKNVYSNAKAKLRSHSMPRIRTFSKNGSTHQSPFRFDIPDDQVRTSPSNKVPRVHPYTSSTRQPAAIIQQDNTYHSSPKYSNDSITSKTAGSRATQHTSVVSKDEIESVMDRKLKLMEDRLKVQMNEMMEELEANMERKMNEIHDLLLNLLENRLNERRG